MCRKLHQGSRIRGDQNPGHRRSQSCQERSPYRDECSGGDRVASTEVIHDDLLEHRLNIVNPQLIQRDPAQSRQKVQPEVTGVRARRRTPDDSVGGQPFVQLGTGRPRISDASLAVPAPVGG